MAKPSSARHTRKPSADSTTAAPSTRVTRSQSHEPVEASAPLPSRARGAKGTHGATSSVDHTPHKGAHSAFVAPDLPDVGEEPEPVVDVDVEEQDEDDVADDDDLVDSARRISGTTPSTTFSQEEIGDLDPDVMIDVLPSLAAAADEFSRLLVPTDETLRPLVRKEIRTDGSKYNKLYRNRLASLHVHKGSFGSTDYLQPSIVLRALLGVQAMRDVPSGSWRPDDIVYQINLAEMLRTTLVLVDDPVDLPEGALDALESLDTHFPRAIAGSRFREEEFRMALSLLHQLALIRLSKFADDADADEDPHDLVTGTFYVSETPEDDPQFIHYSTLGMHDLDDELQAKYVAVIDRIVTDLMAIFEDEGNWTQNLQRRRVEYPWESFVEEVIDYYLFRKEQLTRRITTAGGVDGICTALAQELERRASARAAQLKRQQLLQSRASGTPRASLAFPKEGMSSLKAAYKSPRSSARPPQPPPTSGVAPVAQMIADVDDGWMRAEDDDDHDGIFVDHDPADDGESAGLTAAEMEAIANVQDQKQQRAAARAKAPAFIDRQDGARRVTFDEPSQRNPASTASPASSRRAGKRPLEVDDPAAAEPEDFDPTPDAGFQVDPRDLAAAAAARRQSLPRHSSSSQAGPSSSNPSRASIFSQFRTRDPSSTSPAHKRPRKNPGSSIPAPPPPPDPEDPHPTSREQRRQLSKSHARMAVVSSTQAKQPRSRAPWTEQEMDALESLIEEHGDEGLSWAVLKQMDELKAERQAGRGSSSGGGGSNGGEPVLAGRTAEDLRLKARNMKVEFLLARMGLPHPNWEKVALARAQIEKVHNAGVEYSQLRLRA